MILLLGLSKQEHVHIFTKNMHENFITVLVIAKNEKQPKCATTKRINMLL